MAEWEKMGVQEVKEDDANKRYRVECAWCVCEQGEREVQHNEEMIKENFYGRPGTLWFPQFPKQRSFSCQTTTPEIHSNSRVQTDP